MFSVLNRAQKHFNKAVLFHYSVVEIKGFTFSRYSEGVMP